MKSPALPGNTIIAAPLETVRSPVRVPNTDMRLVPEPEALHQFSKRFLKFRRPSVRVYSLTELIPHDDREGRVIHLSDGSISYFYQNAEIDLRQVRFLHLLSEGHASRLVEEKVSKMEELLARLYQATPNLSPQVVLKKITAGDGDSQSDQIRVARFTDSGPFYLLNGHRRMAALCILALKGSIPCEWLRHIPVWHHVIMAQSAIELMTARTELNSFEVLGEITIGSHCAADALERIQSLPVLDSRVAPLDISSLTLRPQMVTQLLVLHTQGRIAMTEDSLISSCLELFSKEAPERARTFMLELSDCLARKTRFHEKIWELGEKNWGMIYWLFKTLHQNDPQKGDKYLQRFLEVRPMTLDRVQAYVGLCNNINQYSLTQNLVPFEGDLDPSIRQFLVTEKLGQSSLDYLRRLVNRCRVEEDPDVRDDLILAAMNCVSQASGSESSEALLWEEMALLFHNFGYYNQEELARERAAKILASASR